MVILLAYFAFVAGALAVIVTAWIGVGDSAATRLHPQQDSAFQQSYDAFTMAHDHRNPPPAFAAQPKDHRRRTAASVRARQRRLRVAGPIASGWRAE